MLTSKDISILPTVKTALSNFGFAIKSVPCKLISKKQQPQTEDEFAHSGLDPLPPEKRIDAAIKKFNAANELRMVAETNYFAELDNDYQLLQEYSAYKGPVLSSEGFSPVSEDTVLASCNGKPVEIKCKVLDDGSKQHTINFEDGSQINYLSFSEGGKMKINEEEFEMPVGTILEVKSVNGRIFSQLIQTSNMQRSVITRPDVIDRADAVLRSYNQPESSES